MLVSKTIKKTVKKRYGGIISLPIATIISAIVLGISFYAVQSNKQQSIEKQQLLQLQKEKEIEEARTQQSQKEFQAKRKAECLDIYKTESDKWNNVSGWRYSESEETCYIRYRSPDSKSDAQCDKEYPTDGTIGTIFLRANFLCKEGEFENSF